MRVLGALACIAVAIAGLKLASSVVAPVLFAVFLTLVSAPCVDALHRKGLPRWLAVTVTCLSIVVISRFIFFTLYTSLNHFRDELLAYEAQMAARSASVAAQLNDHGIDTSSANSLSAFTGNPIAKRVDADVGSAVPGLRFTVFPHAQRVGGLLSARPEERRGVLAGFGAVVGFCLALMAVRIFGIIGSCAKYALGIMRLLPVMH